MAFKKGDPKPVGSGRKEGVQNAITRTVKETVLAVFNKLQEDPVANLEAWAKTEPTEFYKISSKLIPTEVNAQVEVNKVLRVGYKKSEEEDLEPEDGN